MNSLSRSELIKALVKGLKLDDNIFAYQAVSEEIDCIQNKDFMNFYKLVMREDSFGNGLKVIMKVVEQFKPADLNEQKINIKAKELINLCETLNTQIGEDAKRMGEDFEKLVENVKLPTVSVDDIAILNQVKPHYSHKQLIIKIRLYSTSEEALRAFKKAINFIEFQQSILNIDIKNKIGLKNDT